MRTAITLQLGLTLSVSALAACGDNAEQPSMGPDAGMPDAEPPPAEPVDIERRWLREGFGEPIAIGISDIDGDNSDDIVIGGRGIALIDANARATHHPKWSVDWAYDPANVFSGGDNQWTYEMSLTDMTGDGVQDILASSSAKEGYLVDGATGAVVWQRAWEGEFLPTQLAVFSGDDDGLADVFPSGGRTAYSGATGTKLWDADIPGFAVFARKAKLSGFFGQDILVSTEIDHGIGGAPAVPGTRDAVHAISSDGEVLWSFDVDGAPTALAAADLDGDLLDEAIVTTWKGWVYAVNANGLLFSVQLPGFPSSVHVADTDFSGAPTVFVGVSGATDSDPWSVIALDAAGQTRWTQQVGGSVTALVTEQLDDDFELELLVGSGTHESPPGRAWALDTAADLGGASRVLWTVETGMQVASFARAWIDGGAVLLVGSYDGLLRALEPATGTLAWTYTSGGFVFSVAAGDVDGDNVDEVASGDDRANVVVSASDGTELWSRRLDVGWGGATMGTLVRDLDGGSAAEVIAIGTRYRQGKWGVLHVWEGTGAARATILLDDQPTALDAGDLDGDGDAEVVIATRSVYGECKVLAFDKAGTQLWSTLVASCEAAVISVADTNADGRAEIGYGDVTLSTAPHVALLGGNGALRWSHETLDDTMWVRLVDGALVHGGFSSGSRGHVTRRAEADGTPAWRAVIDGIADADASGAMISGGSWFGTVAEDVDGDGTRELAVSTETGAVMLLDGASGTVRWTTRLEPTGLVSTARHVGGPVAYVPATATSRAFLAVAHANSGRSRGATFSVSLDGALAGPYATEGEAHAVAVARLPGGALAAAFGAGLGVYTYSAR